MIQLALVRRASVRVPQFRYNDSEGAERRQGNLDGYGAAPDDVPAWRTSAMCRVDWEPSRYLDLYERASTARGRRLVIAAAEDAVEFWRRSPETDAGREYQHRSQTGRPKTESSGTIVERAATATGLEHSALLNGHVHAAVRREAVAEVLAGTSAAAVGRELGKSERSIRRWVEKMSG